MSVTPSDITRRDRDRALVEAHCAGDATAFPVIVRAHYAALTAQAHRRLGTRAEAEDAVQETFERAYRSLCRLNGDYRIGAWLHRILANVCIDHARRREVQRALPERIGPPRAASPDEILDPFVYRAVQDALNALPASQRQTFWLHEMDGLSYPEVAAQLGITEDNARARVHRARAALQRSLARTREAVAAVATVPLAFRSWRWGRKLAAPGPDDAAASATVGPGTDVVQGGSAGLHTTMAHASYAATASPVAELVASTGNGAGRGLLVLATSVATAIGGMVAAPVVSGSSNPSSAPSVAAAAAPAVEGVTIVEVSDVGTPVITTEAGAETVAATTPTTPRPPKAHDWMAAGAEADAEAALEAAADPSPDGGAGAPACPWLADYPGILAPPPAAAPVLGTLDRAEGAAQDGPAYTVTSSTTLRVSDEPDGPTTTTAGVTLRARVCLASGHAAIVVDLEGPDGERVQLRGARVLKLSEAVSIFRGVVVMPADAATLLPPWGLPGRFVARFEVDDATRSASVDVAFLGEGLKPKPPATVPTPPTNPDDAPPTTTTTALPDDSTPPTTAPAVSDPSGDGAGSAAP